VGAPTARTSAATAHRQPSPTRDRRAGRTDTQPRIPPDALPGARLMAPSDRPPGAGAGARGPHRRANDRRPPRRP
jgi:hypothetical protein